MPQDTIYSYSSVSGAPRPIIALIALGSNLPTEAGGPKATLKAALEMLANCSGVAIRKRSSLFCTPACPAGSGPDFANATAEIAAHTTPEALLATLHSIEARFGRDRQKRWAPRPLDLDLLACGDLVRPSEAVLRRWMALSPKDQQETTPGMFLLPHPRLHERAFVLEPLAEIAPDWCHPLLGLSVTQMRDRLPPALRAGIARCA